MKTKIIVCMLGALLAPLALAAQASLQISAKVIQKEEIWDRRSNPLMGRPDILKEIKLKLRPLRSGKQPMTAFAKQHQALLACRALEVGESALFSLAGQDPYEVLDVVRQSKPPRPRAHPTPVIHQRFHVTPPSAGEFPEHLSSKQLKASPELQERAAQAIAKRHDMSRARVIFLTSFQGPMPPKGGYQIWGVSGKIKGKDHVWQPGRGLKAGSQLEDPHRHQK